MNRKIIVVGGGLAGMIAAIRVKERYPDGHVILIEQNSTLGNKLKMTGGGRCNLTALVSNETILENIVKNKSFFHSMFQSYTANDLIHFYQALGLEIKVESDHKVFPLSNKSSTVINVLRDRLRSLNVEIHYQTTVTDIDFQQKKLITNEIQSFDHLILATGGVSYSHTGSDGSLFKILSRHGYHISELLPSATPLVSNDSIIQSKRLQGISLQSVKMSLIIQGKEKITYTGDLIITHFGLSGPLALKMSAHYHSYKINDQPLWIKIDLLPHIDEEHLTVLDLKSLPKRLVNYFKEDKATYLHHIKNWLLPLHDIRGFNHAFVTDGGVDLKQINPKTMQSKLHPFVSFAGEIIDAHAHTGGYNLTLCFITGMTAANHI